MVTPADGELLEAWAAGDGTAGEALFARHFEAVVRFFQNKIDRDHDDLIQKTFLGCVEGRAQFRGDGSFRAFLFGVARNVLGKHLRQRYREPRALDFADVSVAELGDSPSHVVAEDQRQQLMLHALRRIPIDHQIVLELHYWEDMTALEVGEMLGVPVGTAKTRLRRAKQLLAAELSDLLAGVTGAEPTQTRLGYVGARDSAEDRRELDSSFSRVSQSLGGALGTSALEPMPARPALASTPPRPPSVAPLELARLRDSVRAGLFDQPASPPRVGGRYELLRCIGRGGMGIVYAARDIELGREVAIKLLRPELSGDGEGLTAEAQALARLSHPNVIGVFDVGTYEGQRFIAMEYVPGQDLRRWLDAPRSLGDVLRVFVGAGRGLHAAHAVGLVHRDFKPDNVLVGDDGRPRVLDFGLARPPESGEGVRVRPPALPGVVDPRATVLTVDGHLVGTPAYMSPEQHLGEPADARSDQFSFGVALYHAVYGVRPFSGEDPQALALSIVRGRIRPATPRYPVPEWLERMLVRALLVDPGRRFASMDALLSGIEAELHGGAVELQALPSRCVVDELEGQSGALAVVDEEDWFEPLGSRPPAVVRVGGGAEVAVPTSLASPPEEDGGMVTSVSTRRTLLVGLDETAVDIVVRELDRLEGRRGKVERLGAGVAWSTRELEVHIDATSRGTEILVWRRLGGLLRRRTIKWMALGFWLATLFIAATVGSGLASVMPMIVPAFVIGSLVGGVAMGYQKGRRRHMAALPGERARVEFVADRVAGLCRANAPRG